MHRAFFVFKFFSARETNYRTFNEFQATFEISGISGLPDLGVKFRPLQRSVEYGEVEFKSKGHSRVA